MKRLISLGAAAALALSPISLSINQAQPIAYAETLHAEQNTPPAPTEEVHPTLAVVAGDFDTGEIVADENGNVPVAIASTTKLMTYLVIKDLVASGVGSMEDPVTFDRDAAITDGSVLGLREGDTAKAGTLLESVLIVSANDSCVALAKHFCGSVDEFVKLMNQKAQELSLLNTIYYTPNGLEDSQNRENTMTAEEMYRLARHILTKYPEILEITSKTELHIPEYNYTGYNTNNLLRTNPGVDGLKTGFTDRAGRCLVSTGKKDANSPRIISVVMGADSIENRDNISRNMVSTLFNEYSERFLFDKTKPLAHEAINSSEYIFSDIVPKDDIKIFMRNDMPYETEVNIKNNIPYPIKKGDTVGTLKVKFNGVIKEYELTVPKTITKFDAFKMWIKGLLGLHIKF